MKRVTLPNTDLVSSIIGLGTWGLGGPNDINTVSLGWPAVKNAHVIVENALQLGITLFDCSNFYGRGRSETLLGEVLRGVSGLVIATKVGLVPRLLPGTNDIERDFSAAHIERSVSASLRRLRRDYVDVLFLHGPGNEVLGHSDTWRALERLKATGVARHLGVSLGYSESVGAALEQWLTAPLISIIQLEYSLRRPTHSLAVDLADRHGKAIVARSVLGHGLLVQDPNATRTFEGSDHRRHKLDGQARYNTFAAAYAARSSSLSQRSLVESAIRYALDSPNVSAALLGATTLDQLKEIVAASEAPPITGDERVDLQNVAHSAFGAQ